jgi:hypothetical protein
MQRQWPARAPDGRSSRPELASAANWPRPVSGTCWDRTLARFVRDLGRGPARDVLPRRHCVLFTLELSHERRASRARASRRGRRAGLGERGEPWPSRRARRTPRSPRTAPGSVEVPTGPARARPAPRSRPAPARVRPRVGRRSTAPARARRRIRRRSSWCGVWRARGARRDAKGSGAEGSPLPTGRG